MEIARRAYLGGDRYALKPFIQECDESVSRMEIFYEKFKTLWFKENKPFGFEMQTTDRRLRVG